MYALFIALILAQTAGAPAERQAPPGEPSKKTEAPAYLARHADVLSGLYGGSFRIEGTSLAHGGEKGELRAERWKDSGDNEAILDTVCADDSTAPDQRWIGGELRISAVEQREYDWDFGVDRGAGFERLFEVRGRDKKVTGSKIMDLSGDPFRWMCQRVDAAREYSSEIRINRDARDHLVTYRIRGLETEEAVWMLFWETRLDTDRSEGVPESFEGLAVEVRALTPCPQPHIAGTTIGQHGERTVSSIFRSDNLGLQLDGGGGGGVRPSVDTSSGGGGGDSPFTPRTSSSTGNSSTRRTRKPPPVTTEDPPEDPPISTPPGGVPDEPPPTVEPPGEDFPKDPPLVPPPGWEDGDPPPNDPPPPGDEPPTPRDGDPPKSPEPGTVVLVALGAMLLGRRRRFLLRHH